MHISPDLISLALQGTMGAADCTHAVPSLLGSNPVKH